MKKIFYILLFTFYISSSAYSDEKKDLRKVEQQISEHKKISSRLEKQFNTNEKELKSIENKSIKIAKSLQGIENKVSNAQEELEKITARIEIKEIQLEKNKHNSQAILSSLMRISSIPVDGYVIASDDPQGLINTRILLNTALPYLMNQAQNLHEDIMYIEVSKKELVANKQKIVDLSNDTKKEIKELENLFQKKNKLKTKLTSEQKKEKAELKKLAKQASSMKEFLKKLQARKVKVKPGVKPSKKSAPIKFTKTKGKLPISGKIRLAFGQKNDVDVTNKGWEMEGNPKGVVTCPIAGEVLYSGDFSNYDNLIVFDNGNGYNLLLAGMDKVNVEVGDRVQAGEPIGFLKSSPATLYLEVRKDGNPIDPVKVLK